MIRNATSILVEAMPAGIVRTLLAKGADTSITGEGETALSLASKRGDNEVARLLGVPEVERKSGGVAQATSHPVGNRPVAEAVQLLSDCGPDSKILAGGQSLIPAMRFRLTVPAVLIDINGLKDLSYIREHNGHLALGAMTRESSLENSELVNSKYQLLADAAKTIADPLVRNMATVGGNIAHADPANDHPAVMLAYNAVVIAQGANGQRAIPIDDFFVGLFESALRSDQLLTEIRI